MSNNKLQRGENNVKMMDVQKQLGGSDCGQFTIAILFIECVQLLAFIVCVGISTVIIYSIHTGS